MLDQICFTFTLRVLSPLHVGSGRRTALRDMARGHVDEEEGLGEVALVQRDARVLPVVEASSLRGALRSLATRAGLDCLSLFGPEDVKSGEGGSGLLWLRAGHLANGADLDKAVIALPYWSAGRPTFPEIESTAMSGASARRAVEEAFPYTFIQPGIRLDRDRRTVDDRLFYRIEFVPAGAEFTFSGIFFGTEDEFSRQSKPLFELMATEDGFGLGAVTAQGYGRVRLAREVVSYQALSYDVRVSERIHRVDGILNVETVMGSRPQGRQWTFDIVCPGPFFIMDPVRAARERALARAAGVDHAPDMRAMSLDGRMPILTGKAILQALRRRSAWKEAYDALAVLDFDYGHPGLPRDDPDRHLRDRDRPQELEITQRLFGVAGWAKTVSVRVEPRDTAEIDQHSSQGLKLDVFSQAPIDGALIAVDVPAAVRYRITIKFDEDRYNDGSELESFRAIDLQHLDQVIDGIFAEGGRFMLGHSTGVGFGAFVNGLHGGAA